MRTMPPLYAPAKAGATTLRKVEKTMPNGVQVLLRK
jgi:hypothetical protein